MIKRWHLGPPAKPVRRTRNGGPTMLVGDKVRLVTPSNPKLDGTDATIVGLEPWGAHCAAPAAATGNYRAAWEEMEMDTYDGVRSKAVEYTGDCCMQCGSTRLRRSGACKVCEDCGESNGCA